MYLTEVDSMKTIKKKLGGGYELAEAILMALEGFKWRECKRYESFRDI